MNPETEPLLELQGARKVFPKAAGELVVLEDVSLSLRSGEIVGLLGRSGSGKSTLLRAIAGLMPLSAGRILYRGVPVSGPTPGVAMVFQNFALFPWLTVLGNVELGLQALGVPAQEASRRALAAIDLIGLDGFETAYPRELSGGMRQKVGFARAMAVEPELLCLDEPFSALDPLSAEALRGELIELWTSGSIPTKAVLMVTHSIEEAVFMADRVIVMDKGPGRVVADMAIDMPYPRQRKLNKFMQTVDRVYATLAGRTDPEHVELGVPPGEPGRTRVLPHIDISDLTGLLEHLDELQDNRADIFRLADSLKIGSDTLLSLTEAAELLGFALVAEGDITLTPLGETFAEASIRGRKEIFATRVRRLPIFRWLTAMLRATEKQQLEWEVVKMALSLEFPPDEAERQLDIIIDWGRYAEILAYDDDGELLYLEPGQGERPA